MKLTISVEIELTASQVVPSVLQEHLTDMANYFKRNLESDCYHLREEGVTGEDWEQHRAEVELKFNHVIT